MRGAIIAIVALAGCGPMYGPSGQQPAPTQQVSGPPGGGDPQAAADPRQTNGELGPNPYGTEYGEAPSPDPGIGRDPYNRPTQPAPPADPYGGEIHDNPYAKPRAPTPPTPPVDPYDSRRAPPTPPTPPVDPYDSRRSPPPPPAPASEAQQLVDAHNRVRAKHCAAPLTWSPKLAQVAQRWADSLRDKGCAFGHSGGQYGENLAAGTIGALDPESVVKMWYDEVKDYAFPNGGFSMQTGHFTQVVWRGTKQVGCGHSQCKGNDIWVCNYDPPGNWEGQYRENVLPAGKCR